MITAIDKHEPKTNKYLRDIPRDENGLSDVYDVLEGFDVSCNARGHAIKKLLCSGIRGKGDCLQDLIEAGQAVERAIIREKRRIAVDNANYFD
tara:strand:+ start:2242 stop:2520 length:279 start_codon:yes stop_codon:yes gene_type:complete